MVNSRARVAAYLLLGISATVLYSLLLPFSYTQRVGLDNWGYLTPLLGAWSLLLGFGLGFLLMIQFHAMRSVAVGRPARAGGVAAIVSLLPSFLCCTPLVPSFLAFVGLSGASLYSTTGGVQHFFATEQTPLLLASLLLIGGACGWSLRKVSRATCLDPAGCGQRQPSTPAGTPHSLPVGRVAAGSDGRGGGG
ncbi:MAG: hypothetical protein ACP5PW_02220 [Candidatus Dormibacteria bacterium]